MKTEIYTIGANGKSPKKFMELLMRNRIDLVIDVRLNYKSQLAGFAKGGDDFLGYILKEIGNIAYVHDPVFAPTDDILDTYHKDKNWGNYVTKFSRLIEARGMKGHFLKAYEGKYQRVCLLCAEETPVQCHRRLVAEAITGDPKKVKHL